MMLPLNATRRVSHLDNGILNSRILDCIIQVLVDKDDVSPLLVGLDSHDYFVHFLCTSCRMEYAGGTSAGGASVLCRKELQNVKAFLGNPG